jgi:acyl-CoA reductase-like NAD-dependent aldehyde dehydrogenase
LAERKQSVDGYLTAIADYADEFARILHLERGGPLRAGLGEVHGAIRFSRSLLSQFSDDVIVQKLGEIEITQRRKPLGVVAAITPWNFPLQLVLVKIVPALLCGNAIVVKPSPFTPVTATLLGTIARKCLPNGLVNVVTGDDRLGPWITGHPDIAKISFTGSTATGRLVLGASASTLKRTTLELGGNDAAIVTDTADPFAAAEKLGWLAFANNGQICLAVKRIYVHSSVYDQFCDRLSAVANAMKIGPEPDELADSGPIQNAAQYARVRAILEDAIDRGGRVIAGGTVMAGPGYFFRPTIIGDATRDMRVVADEQFGPVIPVIRFDEIEDAITQANDCTYGLGSSVWSDDLEQARWIAGQLQAGVTWINQHGFPDARVPLAGAKQSGLGVEFGADGMLEYTRLQVESVSSVPANWFAPTETSLSREGESLGEIFIERMAIAAKDSENTIEVIDPATESVFARVRSASAQDIEEAIALAHEASRKWGETDIQERQRYVCAAADVLESNREEIAWLLVREQGKPLARARGEVAMAARFIRQLSSQASSALRTGEVNLGDGRIARIEHEPLGVTVAIAPWNAPITLGFIKIATALSAGNSVILKPSPNTPLATTRAVELISAHLPQSVLQIVNGGAEVGEALVTHSLVRKVSFTGSTATGKHIRKITAPQVKRVTLELGGNDAAIVLADCDPAVVARRIAALAFGNSGQICAAIKRVYVAQSIFQPFVSELRAAASAMRVGPGLDPESDLGPLQNAAQYRRVVDLWKSAIASGGISLCGGPREGKGYFFDPSVVVDIPDGCALVDEEQFGPVIPAIPFEQVDEAISSANASPYGLGGSVWSADIEAARDVGARLEVGTVWVNQHGHFDPAVPMPLIKESGIGVDYGDYGIREHTQLHAFVGPA